MILTGQQIKWAKEEGYLDISDWDDKRLNPNSYNLRLADELMVYGEQDIYTKPNMLEDLKRVNQIKDQSAIKPIILEMSKPMSITKYKIPDRGFLLKPGVLYLGRTMEYTETNKFVPMLEGRSSVGRLGISIHSTAGFGDIGFCGYWTLEISCVQPVRIYPGVEICQIYYHTIGKLEEPSGQKLGTWTDSDGEKHTAYWSPLDYDSGEYYGDIFIPSDKHIMKYEDGGKYQKNTGIQPSMMWKEF